LLVAYLYDTVPDIEEMSQNGIFEILCRDLKRNFGAWTYFSMAGYLQGEVCVQTVCVHHPWWLDQQLSSLNPNL